MAAMMGKRTIDRELSARRLAGRWSAFRVAPNLYLHPRSERSAQWVARLQIRGVARVVHLGPYEMLTLAEAQETVVELKKQVRLGADPVAERRRAEAAPTFRDASIAVHAENAKVWSNGKHVAQWLTSLET